MPYCMECGRELVEEARFCDKCGTPTYYEKRNKRQKIIYEGKEHKCPRCGEILRAFDIKCFSCGFEIRDSKVSDAVQDFYVQLEKALSGEEKINIIRNFPIPNTKEDICEFMFLAASNFDENYYVSHLNVEDISDAWLAKINQCYRKAELIIDEDTDLLKIKQLYEKINLKINEKIKIEEKEKKKIKNKKTWKKVLPIIEIILGLLLIITEILPLSAIGLPLFIVGICTAIVENKNPKNEHKTEEKIIKKKERYSGWSGGAKFWWIVLNIYTFGIPAIIYYFTTK